MQKLFYTYIILIFLTLSVFVCNAEEPEGNQKMKVESFYLDENDLTALTPGSIETDLNDEKAALIKIETTQRNFQYDTGSLGVVKVKEQNSEHPAEIWLYVPRGVKKLSLQHPVLGSITQYDLGQSLQSGKTYRLKLTTNDVNQIVLDYENQKEFVFNVKPENATVLINGVSIPSDSTGVYATTLPLGTYHYKIDADFYYSELGQFQVDEDLSKNNLDIELKKAFGYLTIPSTPETQGAEVFVDKNFKGKIPIYNLTVRTGKHILTVNQKLFKPFETSFDMKDEGLVSPRIELQPNFAIVDFLISDPDVVIYDNGIPIEFPTDKLTTNLEEGRHTIEVKKPSHESTTKIIEVQTGIHQTVGLESPRPIYGFINIESSPSEADVMIDGKSYGTTPLQNQRMLIGDYDIELVKKGYKTEKRRIQVRRDEIENLNVTLNGYCTSYILTYPSGANVYVDGEFVGTTPHQLNLFTGDYNIMLSKEGYCSKIIRRNLSAGIPNLEYKLRRNLILENGFYIQGGYNILGLTGINIGAGGYIKNVNIEANYIIGLSKSDDIFWNSLNSSAYPEKVNYTPSAFNFKGGYGIGVAGHLRLTPQFGAQIVTLKENSSGDAEPYLEKANATSLSFGVKLEYVPVNHFGISVAPEYLLPVSKSDGYKMLYDLSSKFKGYCSGFGLNVSINTFF